MFQVDKMTSDIKYLESYKIILHRKGNQMAKNIVIYSDGTGQAGGLKPEQRLSNIYKMYRASKVGPDNPINPHDQVAFYDPGLGSGEGESFFSHPIKTIKKLLSLTLGSGININIADCYEAILKHYEPGDRIYLFGFSRGAYTVRCVANVMNLCGIPTHDVDGKPIPKYGTKLRAIAEEAVFKVYEHGISKDRAEYEDEREEQAKRFRAKYGSEGVGRNGESQGNVQPYFIGVFDTVAALGIATWRKVVFGLLFFSLLAFGIFFLISKNYSNLWGISLLFSFILISFFILKKRIRYIRDYPNPGDFKWHIKSWGLKNYDRFLDNLVPFGRHALSIDEDRKNFPRVGWGLKKDYEVTAEQKPAWLRQIWFSGNHSDIGGSYPEDESRLSDIALQWMIEQVEEIPHPVIFNKTILNLFPMSNGMQHSEINLVKDKWPNWWPQRLRITWPKEIRAINNSAILHPTVFERFDYTSINDYGYSKPYRPESLRNHKKVKHYYENN